MVQAKERGQSSTCLKRSMFFNTHKTDILFTAAFGSFLSAADALKKNTYFNSWLSLFSCFCVSCFIKECNILHCNGCTVIIDHANIKAKMSHKNIIIV